MKSIHNSNLEILNFSSKILSSMTVEPSLVDYRNNYFISNDLSGLFYFYGSFQERDQILRWIIERPKGNCKFVEYDGDKEIIVIIPTIDHNSKMAQSCSTKTFHGLHIIFVESGRNNFYFNYAHNINEGVKLAMRYKPKWIIISNDDVEMIDEPIYVKNQLKNIESDKIDAVFPKEDGITVSNIHILQKISTFGAFLRKVSTKPTEIIKQSLSLEIYFNLDKKMLKRTEKIWLLTFLFKKLRYINIRNFVNFGAFGIFSSNFIMNARKSLLDDNFINGREDFELSLFLLGKRTLRIDYKIDAKYGTSLGRAIYRDIRDIVNDLYFEEVYLKNYT